MINDQPTSFDTRLTDLFILLSIVRVTAYSRAIFCYRKDRKYVPAVSLSITISPLTQKVLGGSTDDLSTSSLHLCRSSIDSSAVSVFLRSTISTKFVTLDGYETGEGGRGMKWSQLGAPRPNSYTRPFATGQHKWTRAAAGCCTTDIRHVSISKLEMV